MSLWDLQRKPRILLVEDDADIGNMLRVYFEGLEAETLLATKGNEALSLYSTQLVDLVILDVALPEINGYEILKKIRSLNEFIPVFFLTQKDERADKLVGLGLGADDYITKPFDIEEIRLRVRNGLRHRSIYLKYIAKNETGEFSDHVFISYSHKDSAYTHDLAKAIEIHEIPVWIDDRIDYGTKWPDVIEEKIDSCKAFLLVMSENARESDWVNHELAYAQTKRKTIFPLLLSGDVWLSVASIQYVDVRNRQLPKDLFFKNLKNVIAKR